MYLHEIGHALGLVHEHQLPNRDSYIDIIWDNVKPEWKQWFEKYTATDIDDDDVPYDLSSVMHYGITVSLLTREVTVPSLNCNLPALIETRSWG